MVRQDVMDVLVRLTGVQDMSNLPAVPEAWRIVRHERGGKKVIHDNLTHRVALHWAKVYQKEADVCNKDYVYDMEMVEYE